MLPTSKTHGARPSTRGIRTSRDRGFGRRPARTHLLYGALLASAVLAAACGGAAETGAAGARGVLDAAANVSAQLGFGTAAEAKTVLPAEAPAPEASAPEPTPPSSEAVPKARSARRATPQPASAAVAEEATVAETMAQSGEEPALLRAQPGVIALAAPGAAASTRIAVPTVARDRIYSSDDDDVEPPRLQYSPVSAPFFKQARPDMNTMELLISEDGRVQQVRLLSDAKRMTDMMLLSGAKTWRFEPARREGLPVRYRLEVSWEATP